MQFVQIGKGKPVVLIHGMGGSSRSWEPILGRLSAERDVTAVDLPGFGTTPPLAGSVSVETLADAVTDFLRARDLIGVDVVGSSMGALLVLELARRGVVGSVVSLDPGGFWRGAETTFFELSVGASIRLVNAIGPVLPLLVMNPIGRSLLLAQFSAHPWALPGPLVLQELLNFSRSPSVFPMLKQLAHGPTQQGATPQSNQRQLTIGWGRHDRICLPRQAARAQAAFPKARLYWFEDSGHFPMWDSPEETVQVILANSG